MNMHGERYYLEQLWRNKMLTIREFAEKLEVFVQQAQDAGIPPEDIIAELEDMKDAIEEQMDDGDKDPEEEEEEKGDG
jgi:hypothetical protein